RFICHALFCQPNAILPYSNSLADIQPTVRPTLLFPMCSCPAAQIECKDPTVINLQIQMSMAHLLVIEAQVRIGPAANKSERLIDRSMHHIIPLGTFRDQFQRTGRAASAQEPIHGLIIHEMGRVYAPLVDCAASLLAYCSQRVILL